MQKTGWMLVAVGVGLGMAVAVPIAAKGKKQLKQAKRLLAKIELVDGPGSGLDADTVQGMTPGQVAASVAPPAAADTLNALKSVDGAGSGLDADTLQGLTPRQLMLGGAASAGLIVVDANDAVVGNLVQLSSEDGVIDARHGLVARRVDGHLLALLFGATGFLEREQDFWHESVDCTGTPLSLVDPEFGAEVLTTVSVSNGFGYYASGAATTRTVSSLSVTISDAPDPATFCVTICNGRLGGAAGAFTPPDACCCSGGSFLPITDPAVEFASFAVASLGLTPPFRVEGP